MTNNKESIDTPNRNSGLLSFLSCQRREKTVACEHCGKVILKSDADNQALIPFKDNDNDNDNDKDNLFPPSLLLEKKAMKTFCNTCYKKLSILDYTKSYDVIEPLTTTTTMTTTTDTTSTTTLLWVHGAGGSRAMFRPHAKHFAEHFGYRSILMDLPGHGTLATTTTQLFTLESCEMQVKKILEKECNNNDDDKKTNKVIYIGCSLGAYLGFHILKKKLNHQNKSNYFSFNGAILMDCGQNVGPDCSLKTKFGIWVLRMLSKNMSNKTLMKGMMDGLQKSNADYHLVETIFAAGLHFQQGPAICDCMHSIKPADCIPEIKKNNIPILFFNGSEDHRDSEDYWLELLCSDDDDEKKEQLVVSSLHVYEGGDHFFCHDSRFVSDIFRRMENFISMV